MAKTKRTYPALVLFILSPVIGELLSGSAPPAEFFQPLGFIILVVLYGGGALLVRELVFRWNKGWPSLLALAAAYGVAEEALMCKSFFDPVWMDLGPLADYGRWLGVNWVWAFELTIYHAVFSIVIPIALANLLFFERRHNRWMPNWGLWMLLALWILNGVVIFYQISEYRPPTSHLGVAAAVTAALSVLAWQLPRRELSPKPNPKRACRPWLLLALGFAGAAMLFALVWLLPHTKIHPAAVILAMTLLAAVFTWAIPALTARPGFSDKHRLALIAGALSFFILLSPLQEWDEARSDNTAGMSVVGLAILAMLLCLGHRIRQRQKTSG
ncbi:MAG: hypothetical protein JW741_31335 [Sedimentisphaerales bacterium]|nr:hypothetical protein [Sedimentisphaerales bacterium]